MTRGRDRRSPASDLRRRHDARVQRGSRRPRRRRRPPGAPPGRVRRLDVKVSPYLYIAPFFLIFIAFGLFPLGYTAYVSLTDRNLLDSGQHVRRARELPRRCCTTRTSGTPSGTRSAIWVISTVPQLLLALTLAHLLNTELRGPHAVPDGRPPAAGHVARGGRAHLHPAVQRATTAWSTTSLGLVGIHHDRLGGRPALVVDRPVDDGRPGGGRATTRSSTSPRCRRSRTTCTRRRRSTARRRSGSSSTSPSRCCGRRSSSPSSSRRSAACSSSRSRTCSQPSSRAPPAARTASTRPVAMYLYEKAFGGTQFDFGYAVGDRLVPVPAHRRDLASSTS